MAGSTWVWKVPSSNLLSSAFPWSLSTACYVCPEASFLSLYLCPGFRWSQLTRDLSSLPPLMHACITCMCAFLFCTFVSPYTWLGVHVCICVRLSMYRVGSRDCICMWRPGFHVRKHLPLFFHLIHGGRITLQSNPRTCWCLVFLVGLLWKSPISAFRPCYHTQGVFVCLLGMCYHTRSIYMRSGDLNSGPLACTENTLTTRISPKLQWRLFMKTTIYLSSLGLSVTVAFITVIVLLLLLHNK